MTFASELSVGRVIWIWLRYALVLFALSFVIMAVMMFLLLGLAAGLGLLDRVYGGAFGDAVAGLKANTYAYYWLYLFAGGLLLGIAASATRLALFVHPMLGEICRTLTITGETDFDAILQSQRARPARGEGFADALDVGAI